VSHLVQCEPSTTLHLRNLSNNLSCFTEYATVGYMAKRIQMRKNRFLAIQKIAEQKKAGLDAAHAPPPGPPGEGDHAPKQTVSVASQNCSTIPRGHDAPHAQPHGVTTPATRHNIVEACLQGWAVLYSTDIYRTQLIQGVFWTRQPTINIVRRRSA
jgi:hypothetical protein